MAFQVLRQGNYDTSSFLKICMLPEILGLGPKLDMREGIHFWSPSLPADVCLGNDYQCLDEILTNSSGEQLRTVGASGASDARTESRWVRGTT